MDPEYERFFEEARNHQSEEEEKASAVAVPARRGLTQQETMWD